MADLNFLAKPGESSTLSEASKVSVSSLSSVFSVIAVVFTIGSIIGVGGLFLYYRYEQNYFANLETQKNAIEDDLRPELVSRLVFVDSMIAQVRQLLQSHVLASSVFAFLENSIHSNASITSFKLSADSRKLDITVIVPSYLIFSEQIRLFESSPLVDRVSFGNPAVIEQGTQFKVTINFKPEIFARNR